MAKNDELYNLVTQRLQYNPDTGDFTYREDSKYNMFIKKGSIAGTWDSYGYVQIKINKKLYLASRLAWLITHQEWPELCVDHINGIRNDNRIRNLRLLSRSENNKWNRQARLTHIGDIR